MWETEEKEGERQLPRTSTIDTEQEPLPQATHLPVSQVPV